MRAIVLKILILLILVVACSNRHFKKDHLSFEIRIAEATPKPELTQMMLYNSDQTFFVHDSVFLGNDDIASTRILDEGANPKVSVILKDKGRSKFFDFTQKNVGRRAAMIVDNQLISAPLINAPIAKGELIITGFINRKEAINIAKGILP